MAEVPVGAVSENGAEYRRYRPEDTLLYQIVAEHYPIFAELMRAQGRPLPSFVQREFEDYLKWGRLEYGFLRVRCDTCHAEKLVAFSCKRRGFCPSGGARRMVDTAALLVDEVLPPVPIRQWVLSVPFPLRFLFAREPAVMNAVLGIVIRAIEGHLVARAGYTRTRAQTGAVMLIQRFGSALNLNIHFHMLFLDGVYGTGGPRPRFIPLPSPTPAGLQALLERITHRVGRHLERRGLLVRDAESANLQWDDEDARPLDELLGAAVTYRIAVGPQRGQKAFTLQTLASAPVDEDEKDDVARSGRFSLHAGIATKAHQWAKLERLCRYIARPAVVTERLSLTRQGNIRVALKTPYRDGTTHVVFQPLNFLARLAALVPRPRVNLTRFRGLFAPNSRYRARITPAGRGRRRPADSNQPEPKRRQAMTWAQRLKRVFRIDIDKSAGQPICTVADCREAVGHRDVPDDTCEHCGGTVRIIACIEDPAVIEKILA
jgi:hypothetical protein